MAQRLHDHQDSGRILPEKVGEVLFRDLAQARIVLHRHRRRRTRGVVQQAHLAEVFPREIVRQELLVRSSIVGVHADLACVDFKHAVSGIPFPENDLAAAISVLSHAYLLK